MPLGANRAGIVSQVGDAIPDSGNLHARYDARALSLSDGETVSSWTDVSGNENHLSASGEPTFRDATSSSVGPVPSIDYDGSNDAHIGTFGSDVTPPYTVFFLGKYNTGSNFTVLWGDESVPSNGFRYITENGSWRFGLRGANGPTGGTADTNTHIHTTLLDSGGDWYVDGTNKININNNSFNTTDLTGLVLAADNTNDTLSNYGDIELVEILVYSVDEIAAGNRTDIESYLDRDTSLL